MKKSYIKLYILEFILFVFLILNSFVTSLLSKYNLVIFLSINLILFKFLFGFEKDRHRFTTDTLIEILIFFLIYIMIFYFLGIFIGFYKVGNYFTFEGFKNFIIPITLTIILKEIYRYMILSKSEGNIGLIISTILLFIFLDITNALYYANMTSNYQIFLFIALNLLPAISLNSVLSYISIKTGYIPIILYQLLMNLYVYMVPIVPNPSQYIVSVIGFILPIFLYFRLSDFYGKYKFKKIEREYNKKSIVPYIPSLLVTFICVYFVSGYFHFYALVIGSGSMHPTIDRGDVVIVEKLNNKSKLVEGQVIAFKHSGIIIVHRISNVEQINGTNYYHTKGDFNKIEDGYALKKDDIVGIVNVKIPYIGLPTLWLKG